LVFGRASLALPVIPVAPYHFGEAALVEIVYTTMLAFVALNVTCSVSNNRNQFYGLAIGFVIVAGGYVALKTSGSLFNPALSLGIAVSSLSLESFIVSLWYALVELFGGLIASLLFRICRYNEYRPIHELVYEVERGYQHVKDIAVIGPPSLGSKVVSEFLGAFWLVLTAVLNVVLKTDAMAWSLAGVVISLVYALGSVSGGYFNPAVTVALMLSGRNKCSRKEGCWFIVAQLLAAIPAGLIAASALTSRGPTVQDGLFETYSKYSWAAVGLVEVVFTFLLSYVVLVVATSELHVLSTSKAWPNFYYAFVIGFATAAGCYAGSRISGGYLNPAIALGFAVEGLPAPDGFLKGLEYYLRCLYYWIPELVGGGLAAGLFRMLQAMEYSSKGAFQRSAA
jgi:aquaporin Z